MSEEPKSEFAKQQEEKKAYVRELIAQKCSWAEVRQKVRDKFGKGVSWEMYHLLGTGDRGPMDRACSKSSKRHAAKRKEVGKNSKTATFVPVAVESAERAPRMQNVISDLRKLMLASGAEKVTVTMTDVLVSKIERLMI